MVIFDNMTSLFTGNKAVAVAASGVAVSASTCCRLVHKLKYRQREEERRRDDGNANRRQ
jgi:hypothetical protein